MTFVGSELVMLLDKQLRAQLNFLTLQHLGLMGRLKVQARNPHNLDFMG